MVSSIFEAIYDHSISKPDALCIADELYSFTYREFFRYIGSFAMVLHEQGVGKGDFLVVENSQDSAFAALGFALMGIGGIVVPLEKNCATSKFSDIAGQCGAKIIITNKALGPDDRCDQYKYFTMAEYTNLVDEASVFEFREMPEKDDICELLFSTGTTGKEKGILISNGNNVAIAENVISGTGMQPDNININQAPLNHSFGRRRMMSNLLIGAACIIISGMMNMKAFFHALDHHGANAIDMVPSGLSILLKLSKGKLKDYEDQLRYLQFGSAAMSPADKVKIKALLPDTPLYNIYGSTESGCITCYNFNVENEKPSCIGKPACNADIFGVDEDGNEILTSKDHTGLLAVKGGMNMFGYFTGPAEMHDARAEDVIYTNDEIYFDEDGDIILIGRKGDVINVGGNKVDPEEVESIAKALDFIEDCGCVGIADPVKGQVPRLFVKAAKGKEVDLNLLKQHMSQALEPYKVPKVIDLIDEIPRTYNGKLIRRKLKEIK